MTGNCSPMMLVFSVLNELCQISLKNSFSHEWAKKSASLHSHSDSWNPQKVMMKKSVFYPQITPKALARVVNMLKADRFHLPMRTGKLVKNTFERRCDPDAIVDAKWLRQVNDTGAMEAVVDAVLAANAWQIAEYKAGKVNLLAILSAPVWRE